MTLAEDVSLEDFVMTKYEFSGADIKEICTQAGLLALRECRIKKTRMMLLAAMMMFMPPPRLVNGKRRVHFLFFTPTSGLVCTDLLDILRFPLLNPILLFLYTNLCPSIINIAKNTKSTCCFVGL